MAAVFNRLPMRVRCATQRDHVFHPEMNYSQAQLDQLDRLTERWVADHLQKGKTSKKDKELVTLEDLTIPVIIMNARAEIPLAQEPTYFSKSIELQRPVDRFQ